MGELVRRCIGTSPENQVSLHSSPCGRHLGGLRVGIVPCGVDGGADADVCGRGPAVVWPDV